jgi:carboxylesterase
MPSIPSHSIELFQNPQLDGSPFFWKRGPVGVLLVHGFTATTAEVRPLGESLAEWEYSVCAPLLPGHGTTPDDLNTRRWQDWVDECERGYSQLLGSCTHVFLSGESLGGLLAFYLAARHPEAAGVIAYSPVIKTPRMALARFIAPFKPMLVKEHINPKMAWKGYNVYPLKATAEVYRLQHVVRRCLPSIHQPVLIVMGRRDRTIDLSSGDIAIQAISSSSKQLVWFERSSHCVLLDEEYPKILRTTLDFLREHNPKSDSSEKGLF